MTPLGAVEIAVDVDHVPPPSCDRPVAGGARDGRPRTDDGGSFLPCRAPRGRKRASVRAALAGGGRRPALPAPMRRRVCTDPAARQIVMAPRLRREGRRAVGQCQSLAQCRQSGSIDHDMTRDSSK